MGRKLFDYSAVPRSQRTLILAAMLFGSVLGYFGISRFVMKAGEVNGDSMAPTLMDGQRFLINRIVYRVRDPRPGEIVALRLPGEQELCVKRIVAQPGDVLRIKAGGVQVNGRQLAEPYLPPGVVTTGGRLGSQAYKMAPSAFFVLGDNRKQSVDSRYFGAVQRLWLVGRVEYYGL